MNNWRELHDRFMALKAEEDAALRPWFLQHLTPPTYLCAAGEYDGAGKYGNWMILGGPDEGFTARFELATADAAHHVGCPNDAHPVYYWLDQLFQHFRNADSPHLWVKNEHGGMIERLCEASAILCARLEIQDMAAHVQPCLPPAPSANINQTERDREIESISAQLQRLKEESRITLESLAEAIGRDPTTVARHLSGVLSSPQSRTISAYERVFSKALGRKVVISKTPVKRS